MTIGIINAALIRSTDCPASVCGESVDHTFKMFKFL